MNPKNTAVPVGTTVPTGQMGRQRHAGGGGLPARSSGQSPAPRGAPHVQSLSEPPETPGAGRADPPPSWVKPRVRSEDADGDSSVLIQLLLPGSGSRGHSCSEGAPGSGDISNARGGETEAKGCLRNRCTRLGQEDARLAEGLESREAPQRRGDSRTRSQRTAGDSRGGGLGRDGWGGSCRDWVTATLETPGRRVSESGLLDVRGAPPGCSGSACCPAVAVWTVLGRAQVHLGLEPPGSKLQFLSFEDRGSVAHLPFALTLGSYVARGPEGPSAESRKAGPGLIPAPIQQSLYGFSVSQVPRWTSSVQSGESAQGQPL
ncbi:unnamed protein product [Rangifer tarandus platyrhynchus]|uniref:Uncharacterized protein n=2 Tax=Rangifer tarandus platyrhynchus TaxID=3082113 RepID=A0ABN8ZDC5_RANTA|nr:unnamed protein product [Rangifer tarandus platyrhynchus]CAI9705991.1 unnamed protein product [Rangifer tarandus platyrhynchus]